MNNFQACETTAGHSHPADEPRAPAARRPQSSPGAIPAQLSSSLAKRGGSEPDDAPRAVAAESPREVLEKECDAISRVMRYSRAVHEEAFNDWIGEEE